MLWFIFIIYQLVQIIALPFLIIFGSILHFKRGVFGNIRERLGLVPKTPKGKHVIWLHACSVGEALSIEYLITLLKKNIPGVICYVTVGTVNGKRMAAKNLRPDYLSFLPYDFLPNMLLAYARIKPTHMIILESELWPNLITLARLKKIPIFSLNARINPYSRHRYHRFKMIFKAIMSSFNHIFAQSTYDQAEFIEMGIDKSKITVLGNLKAFNVIAKKEAYPIKITHSDNYQVLLVGSMHPIEDEIYLEVFKTLKPHFPKLKLIFAPRHFGWQKTLQEHVQASGFSWVNWTEQTSIKKNAEQPLQQALEQTFDTHDILLVCKLGELFGLYPYATIYALGGTFVPVGGHNLLEPAAWAIPSLIGPHYHNCKDIADRLEILQAIIKVENKNQLLNQIKELLENPSRLEYIGKTSYQWVEQESKEVESTLGLLMQRLK